MQMVMGRIQSAEAAEDCDTTQWMTEDINDNDKLDEEEEMGCSSIVDVF